MSKRVIQLELTLPEDTPVHQISTLVQSWSWVLSQYIPGSSLRSKMPTPPPPKPHPTLM